MDVLVHDLRLAIRLLFKDKALNAAALLTLALCIGANTAIFSVIDAVLLRPLPYPQPDRLLTMYSMYPGAGLMRASSSVPDYYDRRQATDVFEAVCLTDGESFDTGTRASAEQLDGIAVTPSYFRVYKVPAALGRTFTEEEGESGHDRVAVLGYGLWKEKFGGSAAILGKGIRLSGRPYTVIGVLPEGFRDELRKEARIWVPLAFSPQQRSDEARHTNSWEMFARLRPGVTQAQAQAKVDAINKSVEDRIPPLRDLLRNLGFRTRVVGLQDSIVENVRPTLYLLQLAVLFVLLIGCVNVANLLLVRSNVRLKDLAMRYALGAGRWRLARQLLTESVLLGACGGVLGLVAGFWGVSLLKHLRLEDLPRGSEAHVDGRVLAFTLSVAVVTGVLFGLIPIANVLRRNLNEVFRQTGRTGTAERAAVLTRSVLVVAQISLAFVLLIGSGLLITSMLRLSHVNPGFRADRLLTAYVLLPETRYGQDDQVRGFATRALTELRALPGVRSAALGTALPFGRAHNGSMLTVEGYQLAKGENPPVPQYAAVDADYFRAMGIPLVRGRAFRASDTRQAPPVAAVDEFLANKYWPQGNPVGRRIHRGDKDGPVFTVIGVVGSVKAEDLAGKGARGAVYNPFLQAPQRLIGFVLKCDASESQVAPAVRAVISRIDPEQPVFDIKPMLARIDDSLAQRRGSVVLAAIFAGLALLLSAVGIYGVLAYAVAQRKREIGVRMALGAGASGILGMVLRQGLKMTLVGLVAGAAGAWALTRLMTSLLFGVAPTDPVVFALVSAVLGSVAALAAFLPSLRASRIAPATALRYE